MWGGGCSSPPTTASTGLGLWKSDGTRAGTVLVKDIDLDDYYDEYGPYLTGVGGTLFFTDDDGTHGSELWESDGTRAGTVLVKDIHPDAYDSDPSSLAGVGGTLFFTARDGIHGSELWKSDGTRAGTVLVKDIQPGADRGYEPRLPDRCGRDVVLRRRRRHPRRRAVEVGRHQGGHGPGQGHQRGRRVQGRLEGAGRHQQGHVEAEGRGCGGRKAGGSSSRRVGGEAEVVGARGGLGRDDHDHAEADQGRT